MWNAYENSATQKLVECETTQSQTHALFRGWMDEEWEDGRKIYDARRSPKKKLKLPS